MEQVQNFFQVLYCTMPYGTVSTSLQKLVDFEKNYYNINEKL